MKRANWDHDIVSGQDCHKKWVDVYGDYGHVQKGTSNDILQYQ